MQSHIEAALEEAAQALDTFRSNPVNIMSIGAAAELLITCFKNNGHVYSCGNGGSMCDAIHFAEELSGRYRKNRPALGAMAISDIGHLTCVSNDFGYDQVYSRFIEGAGREGDVLVGLSSSGASKNIIAAAKAAKEKDMKVIVLTGRPDSPLGAEADVEICAPATNFADRTQELHIKSIHILMELVERELFPENYA